MNRYEHVSSLWKFKPTNTVSTFYLFTLTITFVFAQKRLYNTYYTNRHLIDSPFQACCTCKTFFLVRMSVSSLFASCLKMIDRSWFSNNFFDLRTKQARNASFQISSFSGVPPVTSTRWDCVLQRKKVHQGVPIRQKSKCTSKMQIILSEDN